MPKNTSKKTGGCKAAKKITLPVGVSGDHLKSLQVIGIFNELTIDQVASAILDKHLSSFEAGNRGICIWLNYRKAAKELSL